VDGVPVGERISLREGPHTLEFTSSERPYFALVYTTPEREAHRLGSQLGDVVIPLEQ
jgi:hypothetical protein